MTSIFPEQEAALKLEDYDVSQECGFLPSQSPARAQLPPAFEQVQQAAALLPKWLTTGKIRSLIENLREINADPKNLDQMQLRRLMQVYSFLAHAYVWGEATPAKDCHAILLYRIIRFPKC